VFGKLQPKKKKKRGWGTGIGKEGERSYVEPAIFERCKTPSHNPGRRSKSKKKKGGETQKQKLEAISITRRGRARVEKEKVVNPEELSNHLLNKSG